MQNNQAIFETLFNRNFSDTNNVQFLKDITAQHPYFSPAQFFLLQNLKEGVAGYDSQAVKTGILFNNPYWLNFQLQQTAAPAATPPQTIVVPQAETIDQVLETPEIIVEEIAEPVLEEATESLPVLETVSETPEPILEKEEPIVTEKQEHVLETLGYILPVTENDLPDDTDATGEVEKEIEPMNITLKMPEEKTSLNEAMLFEPMHMVDYFASQGIKLSDDVQTGDKLGKQLKSFTEWLKTMKKVHVPDESEKAVNTDSSIQVLAENSNTEAEVLTEAMAEVLVKQGKFSKAGEVYQKLSLLNPAKSTYFAAKIDNLKAL